MECGSLNRDPLNQLLRLRHPGGLEPAMPWGHTLTEHGHSWSGTPGVVELQDYGRCEAGQPSKPEMALDNAKNPRLGTLGRLFL